MQLNKCTCSHLQSKQKSKQHIQNKRSSKQSTTTLSLRKLTKNVTEMIKVTLKGSCVKESKLTRKYQIRDTPQKIPFIKLNVFQMLYKKMVNCMENKHNLG